MVKLPLWPEAWGDQSAGAPQDASRPDPDTGGILAGWQPPGWSPAGSGLGFLLHPEAIAQIDFDNAQQTRPEQGMAGTAGNMAAGSAMGDVQRQAQADGGIKPSPIYPDDRAGEASQHLEDGDTYNEASKAWHAPNGAESVITEGLRPPSDGAKWEAKASFTNPVGVGGYLGRPKTAVHGGIKIYRNGKFVYAINARGQRDHLLKDGTLGNLI